MGTGNVGIMNNMFGAGIMNNMVHGGSVPRVMVNMQPPVPPQQMFNGM